MCYGDKLAKGEKKAMASEPKVSVVMPCYNDGRYLSESIASVRAQTYDNVEVIIVDDGSEDRKTLSILKQLANEPNLRIVYTQHVGPSGARNRGLPTLQRPLQPLPLRQMWALYIAALISLVHRQANGICRIIRLKPCCWTI